MTTDQNLSILADCSENPLTVLPILEAQDHGDSNKNIDTTMPPKEHTINRQSFYVGGTYTGPPNARIMHGQMFVEAFLPTAPTHPLPLILIHGGAQTGQNWLTTPDGRPGWADHLARHAGWQVYIIDQPTRGRSAYHPAIHGTLHTVPASAIERFFTAPAAHAAYPGAEKHTQWVGSGREGDAVFDQYYASVGPVIDLWASEALMRDAGAVLLDKVGPAVLIAHSQGGQLAWGIGEERPGLVRGIVALEPAGPPFREFEERHSLPRRERVFGLTTLPLRYDPEVPEGETLEFEKEEATGYWRPKGPERRLVNLSRFPVRVVTGQASYHMQYDHLTVRYLREAGVDVKHVLLAERGILGNGHMMMLEKNSDEIVKIVEELLVEMEESQKMS